MHAGLPSSHFFLRSRHVKQPDSTTHTRQSSIELWTIRCTRHEGNAPDRERRCILAATALASAAVVVAVGGAFLGAAILEMGLVWLEACAEEDMRVYVLKLTRLLQWPGHGQGINDAFD